MLAAHPELFIGEMDALPATNRTALPA